ncbi:hypothetical protein RF55_9785 [Lasius niger]|uniref:Uncharacterized protein n=1 Tax=Lasius niger TaxID=67767 RepID=A0A0J7ND20_LASNI|nr:hypothetical protein RF55_9785 [Lasius niger]
MDDYLARGHMSLVPENLAASSGPVSYLPHHGILKGIDADAKYRVVFNGPSCTAARTSLNDALHTGSQSAAGPCRRCDALAAISYVFVADVEKMYRQQLEWDAPLAVEEATIWTNLEEELFLVEQIRIPRWFRGDPASLVEVHGFSDASEQAYAAVVYLRVIEDGRPHISLVMAKTRVAPLKRVSLPCLELCAASLLAKLAEHVCAILSLEASPVFLWTNSTVALSWIRGHPAKWTTFVANRVAEIQRLNRDAKWLHVPGRINPADCASRGVSPRELLEHPLWWGGPGFHSEDPVSWPTDPGLPASADLPERRAAKCLTSCGTREPKELARFSSLRRLLRVSAWIWRWRRRCVKPKDRVEAAPTQPTLLGPEELDFALTRWIRVAQAVTFHAELENIRAGRPVSGRSILRKLTGGRLRKNPASRRTH